MKTILLTLIVAFAATGLAKEPATTTYLHRFKVKTEDSEEALSVKIYSKKIKVEFGDKTYEADRAPKSGKRKFESSRKVAGEIKLGGDGFKLRTDAGKLLWKVKIAAEKIKISDNEENKDPFELKIDKKKGRVKVLVDGKEIAAVKLYPDTKKQKVKTSADGLERFEMKSATLSPMLGVLALEKIPLGQRMMLAGELALREYEASAKE